MREENDVRIAVIGNVDSGKSTLVGVLTKCIMDDGRGSARSKVFNFDHEQKNGRTSSIGQEIMGFNEEAKQVELERTASKNQEWSHIATNSKKIVTFLDLCGHEKYLKTTIVLNAARLFLLDKFLAFDIDCLIPRITEPADKFKTFYGFSCGGKASG